MFYAESIADRWRPVSLLTYCGVSPPKEKRTTARRLVKMRCGQRLETHAAAMAARKTALWGVVPANKTLTDLES